MKLSKDAVAKLAMPPGKGEHFEWDDDLPGFGVRLRGVSKRWVVQYRVNGHTRRESLGDVRKVTLDDARKIARNRFAQVELGTDPGADRAKAKAQAAATQLTLGMVANQYLGAKARRHNTQRALLYHFNTSWAPLRNMPIGDIKRADVAAQLQRIAQMHGATTAARARATLSSFYSWAMREGLCEANPVIATNDPDKGRKTRDRVLSDAEIALIWRVCEDDDFGRIIRLLLLTGCRRQEIGALQWSEIDLTTGLLTIPGERTKNHQTHSLSLPPAVLDLLPPRRGGRPYFFGTNGPGFTNWSYDKLQFDNRIAGLAGRPLAAWVIHDLRRTMRTGLGKIGIAPHIAELAINHVRGGVQAIYDRHRYEPEIKAALAAWADHVTAIAGER
jgi:integrase